MSNNSEIMPSVSIIMPCHNGARYLDESINSVLSQKYSDWELLIIDDNSTDGSFDIIKNYCQNDSRIKLFHTDKSSGMPATPRNVGIQAAKGRYIAFLDSDDFWMPEKLTHQLPLFEKNDCAVVFSFYKKMDENGNIGETVIKSPLIVDFKNLLNGDCIGNLTGIYDTLKVGKVYQKEIHAEDYLMWLEILKKGLKAYNTNSTEAIYRISNNSISSNKLKSAKWNWGIFRKELKLPIGVAIFHFIIYAIRALIKYIK